MDRFYPTVVVPLPAEDGPGFVAYIPDLRGCMSHGETQAEALDNVHEAMLEWIDEAKESGRPVPEPGSSSKSITAERAKFLETIRAQRDQIERFETDVGELRKMLAALTERIEARIEDQVQWPPETLFTTMSVGRRARTHAH